MFVAILTFLGSLGLFLYGMKVMSEGLQRSAGEKLRGALASMTRNRIAGLFTGVITTTVIQSSSATTVMLVGFVNAGLINLRQGIGVIMGANIGTTVTFWMVSYLGFKFSITSLALPAVGIGMLMLLAPKLKLRDSGMALVGFGVLFLGLDFLKDSVPDLRNYPEYFEFVTRLESLPVIKIIGFFVFGVVLTVIVQSSSAAGAITLALAYKGWIDFPSACAIVLGENVGTTITANIAAIGTSIHARRAAIAHLVFNLIGVAWMFVLFVPFTNLMYVMMPGDVSDPTTLPQHLALFHTLFNVINSGVLIFFVPTLEKLVVKLVRERERPLHREVSAVSGSSVLPQIGELNLVAAENEVRRLCAIANTMFKGFQEVYRQRDVDLSDKVRLLKKLEDESDELAENVTRHLIYCSGEQLSDESAREVTSLMRVVAEMEAICDCCYRLVKLTANRYRNSRELSATIEKELESYSGWIKQFLEITENAVKNGFGGRDMSRAMELEKHINRSRKKLRKASMMRMQGGDQIAAEMLFVDLINIMERIGNHCLNTLQALRPDGEFVVESDSTEVGSNLT